MTTPIKIGTHEFDLPTCWEDLTLGQLMALEKYEEQCKADPCMRMACLITKDSEPGTADEPESPYGLLFRAEITKINAVINLLGFMDEKHDFGKYELRDQISLGADTYTVPKDIAMCSWGQKIRAEQRIEKEGMSSLAFVIAVYMQPIITDSEFNSDKARELVPRILQMPAKEGVPLSTFFLSSWIESQKSGTIVAMNP